MYYSGLEIIEIAIRIEENGYAFYNAAASMITEPNDKKALFLDLAEKEMIHIAVFQKLASRFEAEEFEFNLEDESDYVNHLADTHIFGKKDAGITLAKTIITPKDALEIALKFENESVAFYSELFTRTHTEAKGLIKQIIEEEKEHAAEIMNFLSVIGCLLSEMEGSQIPE
jgi:rubrerythrin